MKTIYDILKEFRDESFSEKYKGIRFERLMRAWLKTDPRYTDLFETVWLWEEFPFRDELGGTDTGIDLVARTYSGDYWAVQCKCYAEDTVIDKSSVDSFLATSSRTFNHHQTTFAHRLWIATTNHWGSNAEEAIQNQNPPVSRVNLYDLDHSSVDWEKLFQGIEGREALSAKKQLREHQREALKAAHEHYQNSDRGKLVMACGTGKTFTSLKMVEQELSDKGLVLFLVPSIALLGQSLNDWMADAAYPIKAICICSDSRASRKIKRNNDDDESDNSIVDLALPASTNTSFITKQLIAYQIHDGITVVFSTYQSIDIVAEAQASILKDTNGEFGVFDFIVCDEAHRTTGVKISTKDESDFTKIHSNEFIQGKKRLYMTATPRLYGESAKIKASKNDCILCSMDDETIYGKEFYRVNFSYAVQNGILTDYKVLVLTVSEDMIPEKLMERVKDRHVKELNYDDTGRLIGVINGLSKKILGDKGITWDADPRLMRRAIAFTYKIGRVNEPGTSKNIATVLPKISDIYNDSLPQDEQTGVVHISARHVDGSMGAMERNAALAWLAEDTDDPQECRVVTNVRCLSEGVDVPALDAVLFLSARNSQVDVVQSVGRVMRSFHRGQVDEKKYGYIIIPVIVPEGTSPEEALNESTSFSAVWDILNALRSHDDHFNAHVNTIALNKDKGSKVTVGLPGLGQTGIGQHSQAGDGNDNQDAQQLSHQEIAKQLELQFGSIREQIYAKLVEKCGERLYWENWAAEVGEIAKKYIARISRLVSGNNGKFSAEFKIFVKTLQKNLNPGVNAEQCIEMLAQHLITRPVFDALFADYQFVSNNSISSSMQRMVELLETEAVDKDLADLDKFYESVRINVGKIDNLEGKQTIIKNLYEKFFKRAFPLTVEKLGTVYTPVECVDFIIHSVDDVLKSEFGSALTNEHVHILDPFIGTGTFITRLLQSELIRPEDMLRKYTSEIHANEIVLLAYYIADVNIESVFQEQCTQTTYLPFDGLCLTDTFQLGENNDHDLFKEFFRENSEAVESQRSTPIRVIIGNPPYSIGQKSANDNAQNQSYPILDKRIANTYAACSTAGLSKGLYDSYIKAFRWATDRLSPEEGSVIAFISNGAWIDGNSHDGFRASLQKEFDKIYVYDLRGNARTSGELRKREGGGIFDSGSRTPIAITILMRYPEGKRSDSCQIHYHDIGDYLSREDKLRIIRQAGSYKDIDWTTITPNEKNDWINQRDGLFDTLLPLAPAKKFDANPQSVFSTYAIGVATNRDAWVSGYSKEQVTEIMQSMIVFYNEQLGKNVFSEDETRISWTRALKRDLGKGLKHSFDATAFVQSTYRPFCKQQLYYHRPFIESPGIFSSLYPQGKANLIITLSGVGGSKPFSCLISDIIPSLDFLEKTQSFPLYWYEENKAMRTQDIFEKENAECWIRRDGITDWFLKEVRSRFSGAKNLTKEDIFYYVYGLLHSLDYRARFADDLRKSLPRIPIIECVEDFMAFSKAGCALADLHLKYEDYACKADVQVEEREQNTRDEYVYYAVEKMRFPSKGMRGTIIYNAHITVEGIPEAAYEYVVNGKSAIEWVMERYAVTTDKKSGIKNDPNLWSREHGKPRYILDLLLSIIYVSLETQKIVDTLPMLNFQSL
jgi:helicase domain protein